MEIAFESAETVPNEDNIIELKVAHDSEEARKHLLIRKRGAKYYSNLLTAE
jgi:hypothetical protein